MSFIIRSGVMVSGAPTNVSPEDNDELMSLKSAKIWVSKMSFGDLT